MGGWGISVFEYNNMPIMCLKREGKGRIILAVGDDGLFMKENFRYFGKELVTLQCNIIRALLQKDEDLLKSINWDYLEGTL